MTADLKPAADMLAAIIRDVPDDRLTGPTPCEGTTVGELLDHIDSLCVAFAAAARKIPLEGGGRAPVPDASRLGADWRDRIPARLAELAGAWREPSAWTGTAEIGGRVLPAEVAGTSVLDEIIVHGWDLAVSTGAAYPADDPALAEAVHRACRWVGAVVAEHPQGSPGLFGPPVPVPGDAPPLDRLLGLTGRDPAWQPR
ncbi:TIGR03086 family metal-binding protein [Microbispora catharanthi]|uniref:TIGR03086 family protein n=1 Tax=Microbispora catharanthi TaxID=1712871 RepID=A0A5N6BG17_9ACTN|nr:TIGR03086 family metal-binding protein [Microbispora catharanthi]KAB8180027.1 TIGR03086 family protein [Microbispora catharanthi]